MICHKCDSPGVRNQVLGKEFFYCRTCKDEIHPQPVSGVSGNYYYGKLTPKRATKFVSGDRARYMNHWGAQSHDKQNSLTHAKVYDVISVEPTTHRIAVVNDQGSTVYVDDHWFEEVQGWSPPSVTGLPFVSPVVFGAPLISHHFTGGLSPSDEEHAHWLDFDSAPQSMAVGFSLTTELKALQERIRHLKQTWLQEKEWD